MSERFKFILDGSDLKGVANWKTLKNSIKREGEGILVTQDATLEFDDAAATYLRSLKKAGGYCGEVDIEVMESCNSDWNYREIDRGKIFISDIEVERDNCRVKTKMQDDSFYARINNNKQVEAFPWVGKSKT